jgi:aspartate aminotransferase
VLVRHPQVWILTDDMYEHLIYGDFVFARSHRSSRRSVRAHADHERRVEGLCHDRLAHRLRRRAETADRPDAQGGGADNVEPLVDQPVGRDRGVERTAGLHRRRATHFEARRDLVVSMLNQATGIRCATPEGAFYVYPSIEGLIGKRTEGGVVIDSDDVFATELLDAEGVAVVQGSAFGLSPYFRISYATSESVLEEGCRRIQRFCAGLR